MKHKKKLNFHENRDTYNADAYELLILYKNPGHLAFCRTTSILIEDLWLDFYSNLNIFLACYNVKQVNYMID